MSPQDRLMLRIEMAKMLNKSYSQPMTATERVKGGASVLPVVGDAISGYDAYQSFKQGNYGEAALNAVGMLPLLPGLAGVIKKNGGDILDNSLLKKAPKIPKNNLSEIEDYFNSIGVKHSISERNNSIQLNKIIVPENSRNSGVGTKAMSKLVDFADANGKMITLTPSSDFGGNKNRLVDFYKRFGFVENKGKNKDFSIMDLMIRPPK